MKRAPRKESAGRRQQILDAALNCFLENGIEGTTMDQIRAASGASHGSIYHHFGSKEAVALALYEDGMHAYQASILTPLHKQKSLRGGVRAIITSHLEVVAASPSLSLFLTRVGMADASEAGAARIAAINQEFFRAMHDWLRPYIERDEVIRVAPALYTPLILGPTTHFARHWLAHRLTLDMAEVAEVLAEAAWQALQPRRPTR
jgi:AcrR family transcriptional regulator